MQESEVAFLLRLLNVAFPTGPIPDGEDFSLSVNMVRMRLLGLGLYARFSQTNLEWYVTHNNGKTWKEREQL